MKELLPDTTLSHYRLVSKIGAGGMGEVYRARDTRLDREVAIKLLPASVSSDEDRLRRFEQEAKAASALNHPNILTVYDTRGDAMTIAARTRQPRRRESIKSPISVPVSPSSAIKCDPCREVLLNYSSCFSFTAATRVRLPYGTPDFSVTSTC
ncbi:MAG: protein kinase domain-containing protein [Pyrinomonadaceae bacterium]